VQKSVLPLAFNFDQAFKESSMVFWSLMRASIVKNDSKVRAKNAIQ